MGTRFIPSRTGYKLPTFLRVCLLTKHLVFHVSNIKFIFHLICGQSVPLISRVTPIRNCYSRISSQESNSRFASPEIFNF